MVLPFEISHSFEVVQTKATKIKKNSKPGQFSAYHLKTGLSPTNKNTDQRIFLKKSENFKPGNISKR
jgi:hypothetical protein